ncbi:MAG: hypothetical protein HOW73_07290 [Polyangiaceae bacterium]|nr:hypothetical protein [Polyangiaceae bacterium]
MGDSTPPSRPDRLSALPERLSALPERLSALPGQLLVAFKPRRFRSALATIAKVLGVGAIFLTGTVGGLLLHLNTPQGRATGRQIANFALKPVFQGRIDVGPIDDLSLEHARVKHATIYDPNGVAIIEAEGIEADIATLDLLRALFLEEGPVVVDISRTRIDRANVLLLPDEQGVPSIAATFIPRDQTPSKPGGRATVVDIPDIEIATAHVQSDLAALFDADLGNLKASVTVRDDQVVAVDATGATIHLTELLPAPVAGDITYHLRVDLRKRALREAMGETRPQSPIVMWATVDGTIGEVPIAARGVLDGLHLDTKLQLPHVDPQAVKDIFSFIPLEVAARGRISVEGELPSSLRLDGEIDVGEAPDVARIHASGGIGAEDGVRVSLGLEGEHINPRDFIADAPEARVDTRGRVQIAINPGEGLPEVTAEIATAKTVGFGQTIPELDAVVHVHQGEILASVTAHEPGMPVDAQLTVKDGAVAFSADARSTDLREATRLGKALQGAVRARVDGRFEDGELDAHVTATGVGVGTPGAPGSGARADRVALTAKVSGPLIGLSVQGQANASGLDLAGEKLDNVRLGVNGSVLTPTVSLRVEDKERGTLEAGGTLSVLGRAARNVTFKVEREGESARGDIAEIDVDKGLAIRGVSIKQGSIGNVAGSLSVDQGELTGTLRADGLDLGRVQRLLGLPVTMTGVANLDVNVQRTGDGRRGSFELELARSNLLFVQGVSARVSARFDGEGVEASGFVRVVEDPDHKDGAPSNEKPGPVQPGPVPNQPAPAAPVPELPPIVCEGPIAEVRFANVKARLPGPLLSFDSWKNATGSADIAADHVDLGCIERRIPSILWPFEQARGLLTARFKMSKKPGDRSVTIDDLVGSSVGLVLVGKEKAWRSDHLDVAVKGRIDGVTGTTTTKAAVYEHTSADVLALLSTTLDFDPTKFFTDATAAMRELPRAPLSLELEVPRRPIEEFRVLPEPLATSIPAMDGIVGAKLSATGTLEQPKVELNLRARGLLPAGAATSGGWVPAVNVRVDAAYDASKPTEQGTVAVVARAERKEIARALATLTLPADAIFNRKKDAELPWSGKLEAELKGLPFETIPTLADRGLQGSLHGRIALNGLNESPWGSVEITSRQLKIQGQPLKVKVDASIDETGAASFATTVFDDPAQKPDEPIGETLTELTERLGGPTLVARGRATMPWLAKAVPVLDPTKPGELSIDAEGFRLSALYPLVAGPVSKLDGLLTGRATLRWDDLTKPLTARVDLLDKVCAITDTKGNILVRQEPVGGQCPSDRVLIEAPGELKLTDVVAYIPVVGQELHDGRATIVSEPGPDGTQRLVVRDFEVQGSTGRVVGGSDAPDATVATGVPSYQPHVTLNGLSLVGAKGTFIVPKTEKIPITVEGVSFGKANGRVDFDLSPSGIPTPIAGLPTPAKTVRTRVRVSQASFELPASSSRDVQSLEATRGIQVSALLGPPEEVRSGEATRYEFDVAVDPTELKSNAIDLRLRSDGDLKLVLADRLYASGDVEIVDGSVVVNKKKFEIDRGLVRLRPEQVGNPYVNLTAHWEASSDLRVFVDYQGLLSPITDDKIRFRADPPLTQDEIVQMLIFGQGTTASATNLVGTVGGTVATGFANDLLAAATGSFFRDVTVSIGASETESSVGASWHGSDNVTVGAGFRQQQEQTTDRTSTERCGDLYLEWRVSDRWSLRGSSGYCGDDEASSNQGDIEDGISIGLDALWQYRY